MELSDWGLTAVPEDTVLAHNSHLHGLVVCSHFSLCHCEGKIEERKEETRKERK